MIVPILPFLMAEAKITDALSAALDRHCGAEWRTNAAVLDELAGFYGKAMTELTISDSVILPNVRAAIAQEAWSNWNAIRKI